MGTDREGRALAACETVKAPDKDGNEVEYKLRPLSAQHLADMERKALKEYKRSHLDTYKDNADLLPEGKADELLEREFGKVSSWTLKDLPQEKAYGCDHIKVNGKLREWVDETFGMIPDTDNGILALVTAALDQGNLTPKQLKDMTGKNPVIGYIRFDQWWATGTTEGRLSFIHTSLSYEHPEVTERDVRSWPLPCLIEAARLVEKISTVSAPNG